MRLEHLQDDKYTLIQTDYDLAATLDLCGIPEDYKGDITGAIVEILDGDYGEVWLTEDSCWYCLDAEYRPLAYYTEESDNGK